MLSKAIQNIRQADPFLQLYGGVILLSIFLAIGSGLYYLVGLPIVFLLAYFALVDFEKLFFLLIFCIPLSTEVSLPNGFGTDLPTEPLMVVLMLIFFLYVLQQGKDISTNFFRHPISLLFLLHLFWIFTTTITSQLTFVSIKFFLAKTWYIVVFYFMAGLILKNEQQFRKFFWIVFSALMFTVIVILARHSAYGFSFEDVYQVLHPFQRNHVNYAATIALLFPIACLAISWYRSFSFLWWVLIGSITILLVATYLSYTRAAYIAIL